MAKISVFTNPVDLKEYTSFEFNGPYIEWLQKQYPNGFTTPHLTSLNGRKLSVENYDTNLESDDFVILGIYPSTPAFIIGLGIGITEAATAAAIASAFWGTVISFGLSYLANSIFGSGQIKSPLSSQSQMSSPSPVYSLSSPTNVARLGQPIPVIYGNVIAVPDLASTPYSWFENNDQYVGMLFCLGQGWHSISEVRVAATPVPQLAPGTVSWRAFAPDQHYQTFMQIYYDFGIYENMYTSPEVADQELDKDTAPGGGGNPTCVWKVYQELAMPGCEIINWVGAIDPLTGDPRPVAACGTMPPAPPPIPECVAVGQYLTITNTNRNNGRYLITAVTRTASTSHVTVSPCFVEDTIGAQYSFNSGSIIWPEILIAGDKLRVDINPDEFEASGISNSDIGKNIIIGCTVYDPENPLTNISVTIKGKFTSIDYVYDPGNYGSWTGIGITIDSVTPVGIQGTTLIKDIAVSLYNASNLPVATYDCGDNPNPTPTICGDYGIGPFTAPGPDWVTDHLFMDVVFPGGLYKTSQSGELADETVLLEFTATPIDSLGNSVGDKLVRNDSFTRHTNTPQRFTIDWPVPIGRYSVCGRRVSQKSPLTSGMSNVVWTGLKAVLDSKGHAVYGKTTIIAVKAKATNGLSGDALNRFSVKCTRKIPYFDDDNALFATSSNAHAFADIYHNSWYGANRPKIEIDYDALYHLWQRTNCLSFFNAIFDTKTTIWEALSLSVAQVNAFPATSGATLSVVEDVPREIATHCFNESNIIKDSLELSYKFNDANTPDGVEVEYRKSVDFSAEYELYPSTSLFPEKIVLFGCTSEIQAGEYAQRIWNQRLLRREFVKFSTELEGHLPLIGNLITVDHSLLQNPTCYIVGSITPSSEVAVTIEGHKYIPEVYITKPASTTININARSAGASSTSDIVGGYANGITIRGYKPNQVLQLTLPPGLTFTAWSPWGKPGFDTGLPGASGSTNLFYVLKGTDATSFLQFGTSGGLGTLGYLYDGYEAARAAFTPVTLTGATEYTFVLIDGVFTDNSGGLSIKIDVL